MNKSFLKTEISGSLIPFLSHSLATPGAFRRNPSLVWEFYHYRRELVLTKQPNPAHVAIAECEARLEKEGNLVNESIVGRITSGIMAAGKDVMGQKARIFF